jgi:tRNA (guanine-N7-)-methyltransferase
LPDPNPASLEGAPLEGAEDPVLLAEDLLERGFEQCMGAKVAMLELGFGKAEVLIELAGAAADTRFLGVEVSRKRVQKAGRRVARAGVRNVRLLHSPAEYLLERVLPDACITELWINFPDPWPKKRHHKRRLVRPDVVRQLVRVLVAGGRLHLATDHDGYAEWIAGVLEGVPSLTNLNAPAPWSDVRPARCETRYEAEFLAEGRSIAYFEYRKQTDPP